jgi:NAD(P)H dehydrogenase (quinone)
VALVRRPAAAERLGPVASVVADYGDEPALRRALTGADTLVMISSDGPVAQVIDHHANLISAAQQAGVVHVVALSGLDASADSPFCYAQGYAYTERLLRDSGCGWSVARASIFTEFFLALVRDARAGEHVHLPMADGRISLVSRADVARCLAALAGGPPTGRCDVITGPAALDAQAMAAVLERGWRTPITFVVDTTPAEFCVRRARAGEDPWWTYAFKTMFDSVREQRWSTVSGDAHRLTGRAPASVAAVVANATGAAGARPRR